MDAVTNFLAALSDPGLWKRLGIGSLGIALIILGIVFIFREPIESGAKLAAKVATTAATKGAA